MTTIDLEVANMSCGSCVDHVKKALKPIAGVSDVAVDLAAGHVRISGDLDNNAAQFVAALTEVLRQRAAAGVVHDALGSWRHVHARTAEMAFQSLNTTR